MYAHLREKHSEVENPFSCSTCPERFAKVSLLKEHQKVHGQSERKRARLCCPHCDKEYFRKDSLESHIRFIHTQERPFICEEVNMAKEIFIYSNHKNL